MLLPIRAETLMTSAPQNSKLRFALLYNKYCYCPKICNKVRERISESSLTVSM